MSDPLFLLDIALMVAGFVILISGYRSNNRNAMLLAAILLFLAGTLGSFASGLDDGFDRASSTGHPEASVDVRQTA